MARRDTFRSEVTVPYERDYVLQVAYNLAQTLGTIEAVDDAGGIGVICVRVPSGFLKLNPAWVTIQARATAAQETTITVEGVAREGLIRQRAGTTAARNLVELLSVHIRALHGRVT